MKVNINEESKEFLENIVKKRIRISNNELKQTSKKTLRAIKVMLDNVEIRLNKNIRKKETAVIYVFLSNIRKLYSNTK